MQITAAMVKELRERTGAGMMECKKALSETNGEMEAAIELMRKSGQAKADKKAGRVAAEGAIVAQLSDQGDLGVLLEVNCETDFVAKDDQFVSFCNAVAATALDSQPDSVEALSALKLDSGETVEAARLELLNKIGENIQIRRFHIMKSSGGVLGTYMHGSRIGVMVELSKEDEVLVKDVAMHIAASRPVCVSEKDVAPELLDKEKEIFSAQAEASGKPPEIVEKMVGGRLKKFIGEITLLGQPFVKDPDITVAKLLQQNNAEVRAFARYEVGEGIEKKSENFADEVMKQVQGS